MKSTITHPAVAVYLDRAGSEFDGTQNYANAIAFIAQLPDQESYRILDPTRLSLVRDEDMDFDIWLEGLIGLEIFFEDNGKTSGCRMSQNYMTHKMGMYVYPPLTKEEFIMRTELPAPGYFIIST